MFGRRRLGAAVWAPGTFGRRRKPQRDVWAPEKTSEGRLGAGRLGAARFGKCVSDVGLKDWLAG